MGLFFVTNLTPAFTKAIAAANCDGIAVPAGFEGGASPLLAEGGELSDDGVCRLSPYGFVVVPISL